MKITILVHFICDRSATFMQYGKSNHEKGALSWLGAEKHSFSVECGSVIYNCIAGLPVTQNCHI